MVPRFQALFSQGWLPSPAKDRYINTIDLPPPFILSSRQSHVVQMHPETQLKATRYTLQCSSPDCGVDEKRKHACNIC